MDARAQLDRLRLWLEPRRGAPVTLTPLTPPSTGFSADNLVFAATIGGHTTTHILRRDAAGESVYPEQAPGLGTGVILQASVMQALAGIVPVATGVQVEPDPGLLGVPFLIMDFVDGVVPVEYPACTTEGFYADAAPLVRTTMTTRGLQLLARLHTTPWRQTELSVLDDGAHTPGAERQLQLWETTLYDGLQGRRADVFDRTLDWLHANLPPAPPATEVVLIWGDARLGNIIWDPTTGEPLCMTDFEGTAVGERELDVGWWLLADRWMHEGSAAPRLDGEPTRSEQVALYEQAAGVQLCDLRWYELFAALRFATGAMRVMNRWAADGTLPPDHTLWRDQPATALMTTIMDNERAPQP